MNALLGWLGGLGDWISSAWEWIKNEIGAVADWAHRAFVSFTDWIRRWPADLLKAIKWFKFLKPSNIWRWLKKIHKHITDLQAWYKKHVSGPLEEERRKILRVYDTYFKPIIGVIDKFRKLTRIIAIFNQKLAAKIDQRLMALEGWILAPITDSLRRLNQLSSWARAIVTELGYFDRETELESLRRDCRQVWQVLTNPRDAFLPQPATSIAMSDEQIRSDLLDGLQADTGPYADMPQTDWLIGQLKIGA